MANQQNIIPMRRFPGVTIDIEGASALADFEVIKIVDDSNPYPALLGIYWDIDMNDKKRAMSIERKSLRIVVPLDLAKGPCYIEPVCDYEESDDDLAQIYKITVEDQDCVNTTTNGRIAWDHKISFTSNLDEGLEHWKNKLHEVSTLHCNMMTKKLHYVSSEVINLPYYNGLTNVDKFLDALKENFQRITTFRHWTGH